MATDEELAEGGYRFDDLLRQRIVSGRTDLQRKQKQHGFPKPVKTGVRQNWFPKTEVHAWLRERMALRDKQAVKAEGAPVKSTGHTSKKARRSTP
jgi:predicted DNA-binding transcriptional regulator AlpA